MIRWVRESKFELIFLLVILSGAFFLRIFHIDQVMTFLGDQGRDARVVREFITKGDTLLIGPSSSIGNISLGPLYYYMMAPALLLSNFNPVGPVIMIIILNVLTIFLTWFITRRWFGKIAAGITAIIYSISPVAIDYSQCSWNPNPLPLFSLLCIWGIYQVWQHKKYFWLPIVGASAAFALQMHHTAILLLPPICIFWFISYENLKKRSLSTNKFVKNTIFGIIIVLLLMSPLLIFEIKNNWLNFQSFLSLFSADSAAFSLTHFLPQLYSVFSLASSLLVGNIANGVIITTIICLAAFTYLFKNRHQNSAKIISIWLCITIFGLSLLNYPVLIHYLGTIFPAVFILFGAVFAQTIKKNWQIKWISIIVLLFVIINNLRLSPAFATPNRHLQKTEQIANLIAKESKGVPFNLEVISIQNYDESYLYYLENVVQSLPSREILTDQLFVICEDEVNCYIDSTSQDHIIYFGAYEIENQWNVDNINVYRLIHTK